MKSYLNDAPTMINKINNTTINTKVEPYPLVVIIHTP